MPRRKSADQAQQFWVAGMQGAGPKIEAGVRSVTSSPGQKAAASKDKYVAGVNQMADVWARRVAAVPLNEWQDRTIAGASRVASGASAKADKYGRSIQGVFSHMDSVLSRVDNMPTNTLDQRIAKSGEFQRGMAQYKRSGGA